VRLLIAGAVLAVVLAAALLSSLAAERAAVGPGAGAIARERSSSLPLAAQGPVSSVLGSDAASYRVHALRGRAAEAANARQALSVRFTPAGVQIRSGSSRFRLGLGAVGFGSALSQVDAVAPAIAANRVVYTHSQLSEWYANGPLGLEQGFTVPHAPAGPATGPLTLSLSLSGDVHAALAPRGSSVLLSRPGAPTLRYGSLVATDARARALPSWLAISSGHVLLRVDTRGARFPVRIDPLVQQAGKLTGGEQSGVGLVGFSVALSSDGSTALVGGPGDNHLTGAVWVFTRSGAVWSQQGPKLTGGEPGGKATESCSEETEVCGFGRSVALSGDGNTAIVGSPRETGLCPRPEPCKHQGAAWVFARSGSTWALQAKLTGGAEETVEGRFGHSVALSGDGNTALIGASSDGDGRGAAWVFTRSSSTWLQQGPKLTGGGEQVGPAHVGGSVALSEDGDTALLGGPADNVYTGAAWGFKRSGSSWEQQGTKLTATEEEGEGHFGFSVALSAHGTTALVGGRTDASRAGAAWAFTLAGFKWTQQGAKLTAGSEGTAEAEFGYSVALSGDGNLALVGALHDNGWAGAAWEFSRSGAAWSRRPEKLIGAEENGKSWFGESVALSSTGVEALIGAPHDSARVGAAWPYVREAVLPPTVASITPTSGPAAGGTPVTITGTGFLPGASVTIGSAATSVVVVSETQITARTAAAPPGVDEVIVKDERGTSTGGPSYTYLAPTASTTEVPTDEAPAQIVGTSGVLSNIAVALAPPQLGVTGNLTPLGGVVLVKLPGSNKWVPLTSVRQVPFGTIIDARHGKVSVTTVDRFGRLQTMTFYEGMFKLTQARNNGQVLAALAGGNFSVCPTAKERAHIARARTSRASRKHTVRKLWAEGHGTYSTKGNYAAGAVLGTRWLTVDQCGGTLIRVSTDRVTVSNLVNHRHVTVKAGHSYLAKAPG
jgi:hypothetical protein